jgi:16S rRNA (adenine1518-N6/adenine1519-N6)-dimethyltransferase
VTTFYPKRSLGQNFLVDPVHRARIVAAADLVRTDVVLEIGAGDGSLTTLIAAQAGRVVAIELDQRLIPALQHRLVAQPHVTVFHADFLDLDVGELLSAGGGAPVLPVGGDPVAAPGFKVIANLPYYITAAAIRKLLELEDPPHLLVLTVQREVAERIVAAPPHMSLLAVSVQYYCDAQIVDRIPAKAFRPRPKVESATVRLVRRSGSPIPGVSIETFFRVVRAGFRQPRKQLRNSLALGMGTSTRKAAERLEAASIAPQRRAETLTIEEWGRLAGGESVDCPGA